MDIHLLFLRILLRCCFMRLRGYADTSYVISRIRMTLSTVGKSIGETLEAFPNTVSGCQIMDFRTLVCRYITSQAKN